ncbi:MAG: DUF1491 family protein [Alphaproteobacteria bacterium]|nr:DUF1491 family protein [Alphaproteobacteria bacterium]MCD8526421.1 DUF1491 family protein [Alphaproteobacteria bacterium]MCD8571571.1 DUF1491 family protein [Alphaproteobacteria bacterium]
MQIGLVIEATLKDLTTRGQAFYILQRGNYASGLIVVKLNALDGNCRLLTQQRNYLEDKLEWAPALQEEIVSEVDADAWIERSKQRDPDLWVIEIEDRAMKNAFELI